jgi:hypothetical protein
VVGRRWKSRSEEEGVERGEGSTVVGRMVRVEGHALWQVHIGQQLAGAVAVLPEFFFLLSSLDALSSFHAADSLADSSAGVAAAVVGKWADSWVPVSLRSAC